MKPPITAEFQARLAEFMRRRGLSRTDVARMCEVAPYTVSRWLDPTCVGKRMYGLAAVRLEKIGVPVIERPTTYPDRPVSSSEVSDADDASNDVDAEHLADEMRQCWHLLSAAQKLQIVAWCCTARKLAQARGLGNEARDSSPGGRESEGGSRKPGGASR